MPKSKKPRKKYIPRPKMQVIEKMPYCLHCKTETRLATSKELIEFRAYDPTFNQPILFLPQCECWSEHEFWMTL